ncbi:LOW QUALITY PROTEIN: LRR domain containing protein [Parasponia andersonii]|uniref:LRR domain containing protein n=1 Tax=Parasponia andersonii TaxID=3476 RepID=A0A2P5DM42_PARAD|nr:LOW QUALITY PROTEIN: LRR domain containing protein [Parasponia andersonii]
MPRWNQWLFIGDDREGGCFPCLKQLCLDSCPNLTERSLLKSGTIEKLEISSSYKFMASLPLDGYLRLNVLRLFSCENLKELNLDIQDVIESIDFVVCNKLVFPGNHHYASIRKLRIATCDLIKSFPLDIFPGLKELKLECLNLESITAFSEENGITTLQSTLNSLTIGDCNNLRPLPQQMHSLLPSLSNLEMADCPKIESFPEGGLPSSLRNLRIDDCSKLVAQHMHWDLHGLTSLKSLEISDCDVVLDSFPVGLLPNSLTSFRLRYLPRLKKPKWQYVSTCCLPS